MLLRAAIVGNLKAAMQGEVTRVAGALRRAVTTAAQETQAELRRQARAGGFQDGGRAVANAWRMEVYPKPGRARDTLRPAALVWSRMPDAVDAFDKGARIRVQNADQLAIPTPANALRGSRMRITPWQMKAAKGETFYLRSKKNPAVTLWCIKVRAASNVGRRLKSGGLRPGRMRLFVGSGVQVLTGNRKGQAAFLRDTLKRGFLPMFFLMREVTLRKRLDIAAVRAMAPRAYARAALAELRRLPE
jgi:hypothetical protein